MYCSIISSFVFYYAVVIFINIQCKIKQQQFNIKMLFILIYNSVLASDVTVSGGAGVWWINMARYIFINLTIMPAHINILIHISDIHMWCNMLYSIINFWFPCSGIIILFKGQYNIIFFITNHYIYNIHSWSLTTMHVVDIFSVFWL